MTTLAEPESTALPFAPASPLADRFEARGQRSGGMGVVHIAWDRARATLVALKTARRLDPLTLSLFKNEFRALADIDHPHLVRLYELFRDGERWFFTMEFVDGAPLSSWLRGAPLDMTSTTLDGVAAPPPSPLRGAFGPLPPPDGPRLRRAFEQLVRAVAALHRHGLVHRDVKPANIRVEADGRLVLLDFGLVVRADGTAGEGGRGGWVVGSPGYMSPQQASGQPPTPADDWFGVGAVLCVALCGQRPDDGGRETLARWRDPGATPWVDDDVRALVRLAEGLLVSDPTRRFDAEDVAEALRIALAPQPPAPGFVGRTAELARLRAAAARRDRLALCHVHGEPGIGKTALVERFVADVDDGTWVLRGRSHRRADVPFGPFDGVIGDLARRLDDWPDERIEQVTPRRVGALLRLFPELGRIARFAAAEAGPDVADPRDVRQRGMRALRELLARVADRVRLVVVLDDMHLGGGDSAALFEVICAPPDPPPCVLIGISRAPGGEPLVDAFAARCGDDTLPLGPLDPDDARRLAAGLLGISPGDGRAARLARESAGHPFLLAELSSGGARAVPDPAGSLAAAIRRRAATLDPTARRLLERVAVAGRPTAVEVLLGAGSPPRDRAALGALRAARLVAGGVEHGEPVSVVHGAVAEAIVDGLDAAARAACHQALAEALSAREAPDAEALAVHWAAAGEPEKAAPWACAAGRSALAATAFEQAALFFGRAIELGDDSLGTYRERAQALTYAGRPGEAARAWWAVAERAGEADHDPRRRAAEQYCVAAETERGRQIIDDLLARHGIRRPSSRRRLRLAAWVETARVWWAGITGRTATRRASVDARAQFDLHFTAITGLASATPDEIRWSLAQACRVGLCSGSAPRVALSWAIGHLLVALSPLPFGDRVRPRLVEAARAAAGTDEAARPLVSLTDAIVALRMADFETLVATLERLDGELAHAGRDRGWERALRRATLCWSLGLTGKYAALRTQAPAMIDDARARGARLEEALILYYGITPALLAADDPDGLDAQVDRFAAGLDPESHGLLHALVALGRQATTRYRGDASAAAAGARALLARHRDQSGTWASWIVEQVCKEAINSGLCALADPAEQAGGVDLIEAGLERLQGSNWRVGHQWIALGRAGLAWADGRTDRVDAELKRVGRMLDHAPPRVMAVFDVVSGRQQGGAAGAARVRQGEARLRALGVLDPRRFVRWNLSTPF